MDDNKNSELPISLKDKKVCVMGLGFVGLTLAVTLQILDMMFTELS